MTPFDFDAAATDPRWLWMLTAMQHLYQAMGRDETPGVLALFARSASGEHLTYSVDTGGRFAVTKRLVAADAATEAAADAWLTRTTTDLTVPDDAGELET